MNDEQLTTPSPKIDRVSLQAIEAEGTKATNDLAHIIVREAVVNNGGVDLARLERVGPTVRKEVLKLLAKTAAAAPLATALAPQQKRKAETTVTPEQQRRSAVPRKKRPASTTPTAVPAPTTRRATTEWRDCCCDARSFRTSAYRHGLGVSAIIGVACMALLVLLKL